MSSVERGFSKQELARLGDAIYESQVCPQLQPDDEGKFVAIDVQSNQFVVDSDEIEACQRLRQRVHNAQVWLVRVGSRYVHRFGGR
jgi:hypothetical protein